MSPSSEKPMHPARSMLARSMSLVEDFVYVGLGILLAISAVALLWGGFKTLVSALIQRGLGEQIPTILDQILFILLVIELMYTVQVSFREHGLLAEPFVVVALIAVVRRILVITAELPKLPQAGQEIFRQAILELALLTVMVVALVGSLIALQKSAKRGRVE
jgi:uncharacterized membrane protein (DUF373 family)